jgi:hypothetical protein
MTAGLDVQTERELPYGEGRILRPDNLVTLGDGTVALFETEQQARPALLRRIIEGLQNKVAFFESPEGKTVSPTVRVIFYLARGKDWERTMNVWERALATVAQEHGGSLPFRLLAIPLVEFIEQLDWEEPPASNRWENLFDPALLKAFDATAGQVEKGTKQLPVRRKTRLPRGLARRSSRDDRLILGALWQTFHEEVAAGGRERFAAADPSFFDVMGLIHAASHDPEAPVLVQAGVPYASLYLLAQYLRMHPYLRQAVSHAVGRGRGSMRWNVTNVLHRMQVVIDTFLKYHGWRSDGPLLAYPMTPDWNSAASRTFGVTVRIRNPEVLMEPGDGVVPGRDEIQQAENALAWVLWAMFAHASELGLKTPPFW